jgi:hypothetical protein
MSNNIILVTMLVQSTHLLVHSVSVANSFVSALVKNSAGRTRLLVPSTNGAYFDLTCAYLQRTCNSSNPWLSAYRNELTSTSRQVSSHPSGELVNNLQRESHFWGESPGFWNRKWAKRWRKKKRIVWLYRHIQTNGFYGVFPLPHTLLFRHTGQEVIQVDQKCFPANNSSVTLHILSIFSSWTLPYCV